MSFALPCMQLCYFNHCSADTALFALSKVIQGWNLAVCNGEADEHLGSKWWL